MDKEKKIAELEESKLQLEERKRQIDVEIAFEKGAKIEHQAKSGRNEFWYDSEQPKFIWEDFHYRIKEEPRRIPFDGSDAFNLVGQKFKFKLHQNIFFIAVETDRNGVYFNKTHISWADLEFIYDKWNDTLKEWQPCNKVA